MPIKLQSTKSIATGKMKILVYGQAGAGKTTLIRTLPNPVIISAEAGLLSLRDHELPFVEIDSREQLLDVYRWLVDSDEAKNFDSIALDSISEIAEVILSQEKAKSKDPRQAYGEMQDQMAKIIRSFRDLQGRHIYFSAKLEKSQDEMGRVLYSPSMPGSKTGQSLPYFFDEVLALRCERDEDGQIVRALFCQSDGLWQAKDRSGKLNQWEQPDLGVVIRKIEA
jgi:phage nucleotide-binding protein